MVYLKTLFIILQHFFINLEEGWLVG